MINEKPQLHQSMIKMLYSCGEQFRRRYGARFGWNDKEEIIPPGVALIIGIATHKSVEKNLTAKIEKGELLPTEEAMEIAHDEAIGLWQGDVLLTEEESQNAKKVKGDSVDISVSLAGLHARDLAPKLEPKSVERKWVINLEGFPFDLAGQWDIEEDNGAIRDTKTSGKSPSQNDADSSEQLSMYSLAKQICDKEDAPALYLDVLVKTKTPKLVTLKTRRTDDQRQILLRRIERAAEIIEKGAFTPANPQDWRCSRRFCGYALTCPFWSGK